MLWMLKHVLTRRYCHILEPHVTLVPCGSVIGPGSKLIEYLFKVNHQFILSKQHNFLDGGWHGFYFELANKERLLWVY